MLLGDSNSMVGQVKGKLTVIKFHMKNKGGNLVWECRCECGNTRFATGTKLRSGDIVSCSVCAHTGNRGEYTSTYTVWSQMMYRYKTGKRHVSICERWFDYYEFLKDMGEKPKGYVYIRRIDRTKGFNKDNCCWEFFSTSKRAYNLFSHDNDQLLVQLEVDNKEVPMPDNKLSEVKSAIDILKNFTREREDQINKESEDVIARQKKVIKQYEDIKFYKEIVSLVEKQLKDTNVQ